MSKNNLKVKPAKDVEMEHERLRQEALERRKETYASEELGRLEDPDKE